MILKHYRKVVRWFMHTKFYYWILLDVLPYIRFSTIDTDIRGATYHEGYNLLEPGDLIFAVDRRKLTTLLVPGTWTHAAFCVSKDGVYEVAEMDRKGFMHSCFYDICKQADRVCIMRCADFDASYIAHMIDRTKLFYAAAYRTDDIIGESLAEQEKGLYCSGLCYVLDDEHRIKAVPDFSPSLGVHFVSPDDLANAINMKLVWDSSLATK